MEQKMAAAHKPEWCVSLSSTLHVSPTIVAHDQEYEFVITLPSDIVRLTAPSWYVPSLLSCAFVLLINIS